MRFLAFLPAICFASVLYTANGQTQDSTLKDRDGNSYAIRIMPDNKKWMTDNLAINIPGSYCYDSAESNCRQYGRLYTWTSAREACALLGEGWHLPTNEEWQQMAKFYGGVRDDSQDNGRAAYQALLFGGRSGFNALYGGGRAHDQDSYARLEAHGFYWTASESDIANAWFYNFGKGGGLLNRHKDGGKGQAFSVRCVRD